MVVLEGGRFLMNEVPLYSRGDVLSVGPWYGTFLDVYLAHQNHPPSLKSP